MKSLELLPLLLIISVQQSCLWASGKADGDGFIRTNGIHFSENGYPFYANGFNAYWLMYVGSDPPQRFKVTDAYKTASSHGLTVARTWAFSDGGAYRPLQYSPGSYNEDMFKGLDFVISEARKYGIKLILSLANNYDSFGGKKQYVEWARREGQSLSSDDDFFRNPVVKGYYKNHIRSVLNRVNTLTGVEYKNDGTIMAWELMNEPRCTSDPSGNTIQAWIREMAYYVKSIDKNHMLEAGLEGFYGQTTPQRTHLNAFNIGTDFIANNQIAAIDFATAHSYPDQWLPKTNDESQLTFLTDWLNAHIEDSQYILKKPLLIAEFGKSWKDPGFTPYQRDALFRAVYYSIYSSAERGGAAAGSLFWQLLADGMENFRDGYEIVLSQSTSTANLISQQCHKLSQIHRIFARMASTDKLKRANRGKQIGNGN